MCQTGKKVMTTVLLVVAISASSLAAMMLPTPTIESISNPGGCEVIVRSSIPTPDLVILVWNANQQTPASAYGDTHAGPGRYSIEVCEDPNIRRAQLGREKAVIYHFSGGLEPFLPPFKFKKGEELPTFEL